MIVQAAAARQELVSSLEDTGMLCWLSLVNGPFGRPLGATLWNAKSAMWVGGDGVITLTSSQRVFARTAQLLSPQGSSEGSLHS